MIHSTEPTATDVDVVEEFSAIGIGLGPFSADCGAPAIGLEEERLV